MINIWTIIVIVLASLLKGITGFGFALVSLPLLMIWYSPKELIPVLMLCNFIASLFILLQKKETRLVTKEFRSLIISGGIFTILGVATLNYISEKLLIHIMGLFFMVLSVFSLINKSIPIKLSKISYKLAGAVIGFLTGSISVSGPPLALFLNLANVNNQEFREIFSWFSVVTAAIAIAGYLHLGLVTENTLTMTLFFIPILLLGTIAGKRLNALLPSVLFKRVSIALTLISSIVLLVK